MLNNTMSPKNASLRYGITYAKALEMCKEGRFKCDQHSGMKNARVKIHIDHADKYMTSIGWRSEQKKTKAITNDSPVDVLVSYINENADKLKRKGVRPLKSILKDIQKSISYQSYPDNIKQGITHLLASCIDFEDSIEKSVSSLYLENI